jgi:hypothetical protein
MRYCLWGEKTNEQTKKTKKKTNKRTFIFFYLIQAVVAQQALSAFPFCPLLLGSFHVGNL